MWYDLYWEVQFCDQIFVKNDKLLFLEWFFCDLVFVFCSKSSKEYFAERKMREYNWFEKINSYFLVDTKNE